MRNTPQTSRMSKLSASLLVGLGALIMLAPFYFMFVFATHPRAEIFQVPPPLTENSKT